MAETVAEAEARARRAGVDAGEIAKFEALAAEWWDPDGSLRPLHLMNPCRLDYIVAQIAAALSRDPTAPRPLAGLSLLDIGCGGGLVAEPMARLGAAVTGIDPAEANLPVARLHAEGAGLVIDYRAATAGELLAEGRAFDIVLALEVIEHVSDPARLVADAAGLLAPGGLLVVSTLNRSARSFALAILGAEYVLGWLPRGTHDWRRFVTPEELEGMIAGVGLRQVDRRGLVFDPLAWEWRLSRDLSVNYAAAALKPA